MRSVRDREENAVEFSRIVAFSDGVFAIAITLLVLGLEVPSHLHGKELSEALWDQRQNLFAYAISFAVIGRFWIIHHRFFAEVTGFDGRLLALNLFYLAWIVLIPFSSKVLGDHGGETAAIVLYAANLAGVVLVGLLMFRHAHRSGLSRAEPSQARDIRRRSLIIAAVFLASIPVALVDATAAQFVWLCLLLEPLLGGPRRA
jgi:uncharacterized membrane protein